MASTVQSSAVQSSAVQWPHPKIQILLGKLSNRNNIFACYLVFFPLAMRMSLLIQCGEWCLYNIVCSEHEYAGVNLINYCGCPAHSTLHSSLVCTVFINVHTVQISLICMLLVVSTVHTVRCLADSAIFPILCVLVLHTHLSGWAEGYNTLWGGASKSHFGKGLLNIVECVV